MLLLGSRMGLWCKERCRVGDGVGLPLATMYEMFVWTSIRQYEVLVLLSSSRNNVL